MSDKLKLAYLLRQASKSGDRFIEYTLLECNLKDISDQGMVNRLYTYHKLNNKFPKNY